MSVRRIVRAMLGAACAAVLLNTAARTQTLEDIWAFKYAARPAANLRWHPDDQFYTDLTPAGDLVKISVLSQTHETIIPADRLVDPATQKNIPVADYSFSKNGQKILVLSSPRKKYRYSASYVAYVYDVETQKCVSINDGKPVFLPTLFPDGALVGFVYENNLYVQNLKNGKILALTSDGQKNRVINGHTDWVYEEEFGFTQAFHVSPSGRYVAYYRFDESGVPEFSMPMYTGLYPENYTFKYPKAGDPNAVVTLHFYDLKEKKSISID
ncbi:MAG: DPP IV N-terminal domain-containing protein, partial [Bacteroidia bacterium]|nr:DPP IV N-terminal domain-containing protein [Bacteroidia bacterium]